jgi:hypothetical protein
MTARRKVAAGTKCKHCGEPITRTTLLSGAVGDKVWIGATGNIWCSTNMPGLTARFHEPEAK